MKNLFYLIPVSAVLSTAAFSANPSNPFLSNKDLIYEIEGGNKTPKKNQNPPAPSQSTPVPGEAASPEQPASTPPSNESSAPATGNQKARVINESAPASTPATPATSPTPVKPSEEKASTPETSPAPVKPSEEKAATSPTPVKTAASKAEKAASSAAEAEKQKQTSETNPEEEKILVRFTDINVVELIKFISRISQKNFIFNENELNFAVTIVSDEPTTVENILTALLQELRIHGMTMMENGNTIVIHKNPNVNAISRVETSNPENRERKSEIVTQVFQLNTLDPENAMHLVKPLTSSMAQVESSPTTQHLIVTDLDSNIREIGDLLKSLDAPNSGMVIGQYVVQVAQVETLISLAEQIMNPIVNKQPLIMIPQKSSSSIFVVATPFLVEKTLSVLQNLDQMEGSTRIMNLKEMKYEPIKVPAEAGKGERGHWELDSSGRWVYKPGVQPTQEELHKGSWQISPEGNWYFNPKKKGGKTEREMPKGEWVKSPKGQFLFRLAPGEKITTKKIEREPKITEDLPVGHIERTQFYLHKLRYRKGEQIETALRNVGNSLEFDRRENLDLISAINTIQWIQETNSLVFTGTPGAVEKVKELIDEIDTPLRQVFIEMLILETDIDDSLTYGVNWMSRFGGGNTSGAQAFISGASALPGAMDTTGIGTTGPKTPDASTMARSEGYNLGIIGRSLMKGGTEFASIGALVKALHTDTRTNIVLNPKILTEDNAPANIFVGINTEFQTNSIVNDQGSIVTNNYEFRDVGTTLKVTPRISSANVVTMEIDQELSSVIPTSQLSGNQLTQPTAGPTTRQTRTTTRVHIPDGYFLVMSGMIQRESTRSRGQVPCLGGIPVLGGLFSQKDNTDSKRNILIFLRPEIIDTEEEIQNLTRHQQNIYKQKNHTRSLWKYEVDETLDLLNIENKCGSECE